MELRRKRGAGRRAWLVPSCLALLVVPPFLCADEPVKGKPPPRPAASRPYEPLADALSLAKSAEFLDAVTLGWIKRNQCASCHTGFPYLLARPALGEPRAPALLEVRTYLEDRVAAWDRGGKGAGMLKGDS